MTVNIVVINIDKEKQTYGPATRQYTASKQ
jgi:hypothetical protein